MRGARGRRTALVGRRAGAAGHGVLGGRGGSAGSPGVRGVPGIRGADPPGVCRACTSTSVRATPPVSYVEGRLAAFPQRRRRLPGDVAATSSGGSCRRGWPGRLGGGGRVGQSGYRGTRTWVTAPAGCCRSAAHRRGDRATDRIVGAPGDHPTFCRHGGGLVEDGHGLWIARGTAVARRPRARRPAPPGAAGVAAGAGGARVGAGGRRLCPVLGIGAWRRRLPGPDALVPPPSTCWSPGCHVELGGRSGRPGRRRSAAAVADPLRPCGGCRARPARSGRGLVDVLDDVHLRGCWCSPDGRRVGFPPGAEGLDLDGRGRGVDGAGVGVAHTTRCDGLPLVPMLVQLRRRPAARRGDRCDLRLVSLRRAPCRGTSRRRPGPAAPRACRRRRPGPPPRPRRRAGRCGRRAACGCPRGRPGARSASSSRPPTSSSSGEDSTRTTNSSPPSRATRSEARARPSSRVRDDLEHEVAGRVPELAR